MKEMYEVNGVFGCSYSVSAAYGESTRERTVWYNFIGDFKRKWAIRDVPEIR